MPINADPAVSLYAASIGATFGSSSFLAHPVSDSDGDKFLPPYDRNDEYPCHRTLSLQTRLKREKRRLRGSLHTMEDMIPETSVLHSTSVVSLHGTGRAGGDARIRAILKSWNLPDELAVIADALIFEGASMSDIGRRIGMPKQSVHRRVMLLRTRLMEHVLADETFGMESVMMQEAHRTIKGRLETNAVFAHRPVCVGCGSPHFQQQVCRDQSIAYTCESCGRRYTEARFEMLIRGARPDLPQWPSAPRSGACLPHSAVNPNNCVFS